MNLSAIQKFCAGLPQAKAEIKWEIDHVFTIGAKMFAVAYESRDGEGNSKVHVGFKVDDDLFLQFTDRPGFMPAPYLARAKWVRVTDLKAVSDTEMKALLRRSYDLVCAKLTKKTQGELGLLPKPPKLTAKK
jgi:predicted DNA-binding protein (MmcQ/YjbR family)